MQEYVDVLTADGEYTWQKVLKTEAHKKGLFHPTVHIWLYTNHGKVLVQQRAATKETFPLLWDVSVAGHVSAGEAVLAAAQREVKEELGLSINSQDLQKIGVFRSVKEHSANFTDCEFHHTFIHPLKVPLEELEKEESEVADLALLPLIQLTEEIWGLARPQKYVPHERSYYKAVFRAIKEQL